MNRKVLQTNEFDDETVDSLKNTVPSKESEKYNHEMEDLSMDTKDRIFFNDEIDFLQKKGFHHHDTVKEDDLEKYRFIDHEANLITIAHVENIVCWELGQLLYNGQADIGESGCDDKSHFMGLLEEFFERYL